jgi:hypothetical protein
MAVLRRVSAVVTCDGSGDATVYTDSVNGFLDSVFMDYASGATGTDYTITEEDTGKALLTITNAGVADLNWRPRVGAHPVANTAGGTLIPGGTTTGGDGIAQYANAVIGRIKIVAAQGGAAGANTLYFYLQR